MNRYELAQDLITKMDMSVKIAEANNQHPMEQDDYANKMQALSILSTLRDAENFGRPLVHDDKAFVACDGKELRVLHTVDEARGFLAQADEEDARLFGIAIIEVDPATDTYRRRE